MPYIYSDEGATELLLKPASKMDRDTGHLEASRPFHRWTDSFRAKKHRRVQPVQPVQLLEKYVQGLEVDGVAVEAYGRAPYGDKSSEQLSDAVTGNLSFLGPVTTASVTVTSINGVRSRTNTQSTSHLGPPRSGNRISMDSVWSRLGPFPDKAAFDRAVKRRQVLCEVFQTEKDYIQGLQALTDVSPPLTRLWRMLAEGSSRFCRCSSVGRKSITTLCGSGKSTRNSSMSSGVSHRVRKRRVPSLRAC